MTNRERGVSMRKALCVGINYYSTASKLKGCVSDARNMARVLSRNGNGELNFETKCISARDKASSITLKDLRDNIRWLFEDDPEVALFYFAGHGAVDTYGGYLCTSEISNPEDGMPLQLLMEIVKQSKARNKIIILDSCHSGFAGKISPMSDYSVLPDNTIVLAACRDSQYAYDGLFTPLVVDALRGGAMNLLGEVTPASIYSYVDRAMGAWLPRPVFKANIKNFICLRTNKPPISIKELRALTRYFKTPDMKYQLDPTYEEDKSDVPGSEVNKEHEAIFELLCKYAQLNLLVPIDTLYMHQAAIKSKCCKLTAQGQYYWMLVKNDKI